MLRLKLPTDLRPSHSNRIGWVLAIGCLGLGAADAVALSPGSENLSTDAAPASILAASRAEAESGGVTFAAELTSEYSHVLDGGVREDGSSRHLFTFDIDLDMQQAAGIEGGSMFLQFLSVNAERGGAADTGDIQVYSNLENDRSLSVLYELWYQQLLMDDRVRIKVGKVDANTEFGFVDAAGDFANSSAGFSPTLFTFPSYPDPSMSLNVFFTVFNDDSHALTLGYGLYDGAAGPDGVAVGSRGPSTFFSDDRSGDYFHIAEAELAWDQLGDLHEGRFAAGGWWHSGDFDEFDGGRSDGTGGFYLLAEQRLTESDGPNSETGVYVFAQYGWADEMVSEIGQHLAGGLVCRGPIPGRPDDTAGVYVSTVDLSDEPGAGFGADETAVELYYRLQVNDAVYVQPQLQMINNPSGDPSLEDVVVGGVRVGVSF